MYIRQCSTSNKCPEYMGVQNQSLNLQVVPQIPQTVNCSVQNPFPEMLVWSLAYEVMNGDFTSFAER